MWTAGGLGGGASCGSVGCSSFTLDSLSLPLLNYEESECTIRPKSYYDNRQRSYNCYNANYNCYF